MFYIASIGDDCTVDYEEFSYKYGKFEGLYKGHCGCVANNIENVYSTYPNCTDGQYNSGYCMTSNQRSGFEATTWRNQKVCFKRSGEPAASWENGF